MFKTVSTQAINSNSDDKSTVESSQIIIEFLNEKNKTQHKKTVLTWLEAHFKEQVSPDKHFWHNKSIIEDACDGCNAMIALNSQKEFAGYMIWERYNLRAEINIVEVKEEYRRQGVLRQLLAEFSKKFTDVRILSASVLPQAEKAFCALGWEKIGSKHINIIEPGLKPFDTLPDGPVIAIAACSSDFYAVKANPEKYKNSMQYFQIKTNKEGQLHEPIMTPFHYEGYMGIYINKKLIIDGKTKHIFKENEFSNAVGFLIVTNIIPQKPELFKDFFSHSNKDDTSLIQQAVGTTVTHLASTLVIKEYENNEKSEAAVSITGQNGSTTSSSILENLTNVINPFVKQNCSGIKQTTLISASNYRPNGIPLPTLFSAYPNESSSAWFKSR